MFAIRTPSTPITRHLSLFQMLVSLCSSHLYQTFFKKCAFYRFDTESFVNNVRIVASVFACNSYSGYARVCITMHHMEKS